jgi:hypothetical protein
VRQYWTGEFVEQFIEDTLSDKMMLSEKALPRNASKESISRLEQIREEVHENKEDITALLLELVDKSEQKKEHKADSYRTINDYVTNILPWK